VTKSSKPTEQPAAKEPPKSKSSIAKKQPPKSKATISKKQPSKSAEESTTNAVHLVISDHNSDEDEDTRPSNDDDEANDVEEPSPGDVTKSSKPTKQPAAKEHPKSKSTKRKATEVEETRSKRQKTLERKVRLRMATADDDDFSKEAVDKTVFTQKSRSDAFTISKPDVSMIRTFVYDKGLIGGSQPELLKELLEELGVDDDDEFAIQLKVKQKVSNLNRTRREFMEMVAEDDMGDVRDRLLKILEELGKRPGGSAFVRQLKESIAVEEDDDEVEEAETM
jgi:hypothetical protein